ncbi:universal stress protein [Rhodophyticola porphyridii]|uniref:Universal stress protein UspA n=1 Tax=Rhodophyticola porphyridii TaxID=1852017 RepID=A0A3L9XX77_9RHOB|nr:universal stress protein [Rhodophyticola porphyridii]RMA41184.1 universal stress protein UspA [Rhodophyticola porphyridii]
MQRFRSILAVLTEDSLHEVALARAVHLAKLNGAALTLVDVIDAAPGELGRLLSALQGRRGTEIEEDVIAYHRDRLTRLADTARAEGVEVTEAVLQGSAFVEVIRMVLREGHDIVIKGATAAAHGKGVLKGPDMHLLRKCPCPVWMLKGPGDGVFDTILATVDPEPHGDEARDKLDRLVLDLATSLAERDNATCHVAHAWRLQEEYALRHGRYTSKYQGEVDRMVEREKEAAKTRLNALLANYPQVKRVHVHMLKGLPGDAIAEFAETHKPDLIVMGTVGRTGISGFIMGNTAETILHRVDCAVIAVKPEGFVSPVTLEATS